MINNKGFFTIPLVVFMLIFIGFASYLFIISDKTSNYVHIGGTASNIFSAYQETEKALFFIDKSADYSVYKTLRNVKLDFNIKEVFLDANNKLKEIYLSCKSDKNCWEDKKTEGIIVQDNGKLFIIEVDTEHRFGLYDEKLVLRFGLNFETNPLFR